MNENVKAARPLIAVVQLEDIRLAEGKVASSVRSVEEAGEFDLTLDYKGRCTRPIRGDRFVVTTTMKFAVLRTSTERARPAVSVNAKYELFYSVPEDFTATKKECDAFASVNGIYNAWPYFREFVQSGMQRMGLPPMTLPVYRVPRPSHKRTSSDPEDPQAKAGK